MSEENETQPVEPIPHDTLEQYFLHGRRQIRQLLQELIDNRALVSAHLFPGGQSFLTAPVTLSDDEDWLFLDASTDVRLNARAVASERLECATQLDKIRIQFGLEHITEVQLDGRPTLAAPVPDRILRLQRREYFRLRIPLSHEVVCRIPSKADGTPEDVIEARVVDISTGGVALQFPATVPSPTIGATLGGCRLILPETGTLEVALQVRNIARQTGRSGVETLRIGCSFANLPRAADTQIQRYIFRTERERSARERGSL